MSETIGDQVRRLVGEMSPLGARSAKSTDRLVEDLGYDSLAVIELSLQLETHFGLRPVAQGTAVDITTVAGVEQLVEEALAATDAA